MINKLKKNSILFLHGTKFENLIFIEIDWQLFSSQIAAKVQNREGYMNNSLNVDHQNEVASQKKLQIPDLQIGTNASKFKNT